MKTRDIIKKTLVFALVLTIAATFTACGTDGGEGNQNPDADDVPTQIDQSPYHAKYKEALQNMIDNRVFPNGEQLYTNDGDNETVWGDNQFAITDIDGDGIDELLINFGNAPMAGEQFFVFQYEPDSDTFREELTEFPAAEFYDNGYVTVQASHNQGMAGEFWPYAIYQYDVAKDTYEQKYYIDAWDQVFYPKDYDGNPYPDAVDTSKTGIVYYIYEDVTKEVDPVDKSEYDSLVTDTYGSATEVTIDYVDITQENIDAIS